MIVNSNTEKYNTVNKLRACYREINNESNFYELPDEEMNKLNKFTFQRYVINGDYKPCEFKDLKDDDIFVLFEPNIHGTIVIDVDDICFFVAYGDAFLDDDGVTWKINTIDFNTMMMKEGNE